ncbi:hypothetical protein [Motiliproteus sp. MSK22-1]|uniref:hypothetical protein n=1 Tax=Motiliproteus sp. MSK22-1 TaxID=1897630 RepID=UPI0009787A37|nr:hypothetical protein [Motiliproteus sp. MSK22-1]OMH38189.1 hypothetical protein BGP75_07995 [Motiliproteus sp. MSK22-1]
MSISVLSAGLLSGVILSVPALAQTQSGNQATENQPATGSRKVPVVDDQGEVDDSSRDPVAEFWDRRQRSDDADWVTDQSGYTEIPVDRIDGDIPEDQYPEIVPDRFSGGTQDARTVYRDMADGFDSEPMIETLPGDDPELALPEPTVVPVDQYGGMESVVIPAGVIEKPKLTREDIIFEYLNSAAEVSDTDDTKAPVTGSRIRERVTVPINDKESAVEVIVE